MIALFFGELTAVFSPSNHKRSHGPVLLNHKRFRRWILVFGAVPVFSGLITLTSSWLVFGNVITHAQDLKLARVEKGIQMYAGTPFFFLAKYLLLLQGFSYAGCILGALYQRTVAQRYWLPVLLPVLGTIMFDLGWGARTHIFSVMLIFIAVEFFVPTRPARDFSWSSTKKRAKTSKILALLVIVSGILLMNIIGRNIHKQKTYEVKGRNLPFSLVQFVDYLAGPLVGFDQTLDDNPRTWGRISFWGVEKWLRMLRIEPYSVPPPSQLLDWEKQYIRIQSNNDWYRVVNTWSWLRFLYSDFGIFGLVMIPFLLGLIATLSAKKWMAQNHAFPSLLLCTVCYIIILRSPLKMLFRNSDIVFAMILLFIAGMRIRKSPKPYIRIIF
jgi:oligosaccharide repeat unit polymerase